MVTQQNKELAATVAGGYVGYRIGNWMIPFLVVLVVIVFSVGGVQCMYRAVTGAPAVVEPQIDAEFSK